MEKLNCKGKLVTKQEKKKEIEVMSKQMKPNTQVNKKKGASGITLIALIITIVILIILATITVNFLFGENGVINRAQQGSEEYSKAEAKEKVELLLSEYVIDKATGENDNFANFLRKNLQVGVAENDDNTYSFMLGEWQVVTTENKVISIEKFKLDVDKTYPSVASMKADTELTEGQLVQTEGYWDKQYAGGAYYDIVSSTSLTADDGKCIQLDNGLYAELHVINDTVTVNQFGAYGDGEHDDAGAINVAINTGYSNIQFENSEYRINSRIDITTSNITVLGNEATIFYDDNFTFRDDFIIRIYNSNTNYVNNVSLSNLKLIDRNTTREQERLMLKVMYAENIDIYKCNIEAYNVEGNNNRAVTNIDLRGYWNGINISECNLINTTYGPAGGTIWIRCGADGTGNLIMENNYIKKSCHDETIALFGDGTAENVKIQNNTIEIDDTNVEQKSSPVINLGMDSKGVKNIEFTNNNLTIIAQGGFIRIFNATNVLIENNTMNITSIVDYENKQWFTASNSENTKLINNNMSLKSLYDNSDEIICNIDTVKQNDIKIDATVAQFGQNICDFENNIISFDSELLNTVTSMLLYRGTDFYKNINITNNIFNINQKALNELRFINVTSISMNNCTIYANNNRINEKDTETNYKRYAIYFQNMRDTTPQNVYFRNNILGTFTNNIGRYNNSTDYNVIEE